MSATLDERVLALAGLVQALRQVRLLADNGRSEAQAVATAIDSVFRIDADSPEAVYGGRAELADGLRWLHARFSRQPQDDPLARLALAVLQLERRFVAAPGMAARVHAGIVALQPPHARGAAVDPAALQALGKLYSSTLSELRPRVLVQGNPHYLAQADLVNEIRALLLAAVRSAVLWRQLGGSLWDFLLRRRELIAAIDRQLA